jgi:hypothetical protein
MQLLKKEHLNLNRTIEINKLFILIRLIKIL